MNVLHRALVFAIPSALAISACAPQAAAPPPRQEASPVAASPVAAATVAVRQHPSLGPMLTDAAGRTLYRFSRDTPGTSSCYDQCAAAWPPLLAQGQPTAPPGLPGRLSLTARTDRTQQVTYNDMPLHYFGGDAQPGDTNGQGVGNLWFLVNPG